MNMAMNPVLGRELRQRMRGFRAFGALLVFLGFLVLAAYFVYLGNRGSQFGVDIERQSRVGRDMFEWLLFVMVLLMLFLVPGLTAGAVAGERERQTLLPLQVTPLSGRSILWGKVLAALAFLGLMAIAALPLFAICYELGGLTIVSIVRGLLAVMVVAVVLAAMVVAISAFAKRVQTATLLAYGFTALLSIGAGLAYGAIALVDGTSGGDQTSPPTAVLLPNPFTFVAAASSAGADNFIDTPLAACVTDCERPTRRTVAGSPRPTATPVSAPTIRTAGSSWSTMPPPRRSPAPPGCTRWSRSCSWPGCCS
ncbi:MAG: ABC transporter permease subunit [Ilumatobacteraceae bacterium]